MCYKVGEERRLYLLVKEKLIGHSLHHPRLKIRLIEKIFLVGKEKTGTS